MLSSLAVPLATESPILNPSQRRIVGAALILLAFLGSIALVIAAMIVLGRLLAFFSSVLWPLAVAGVLALLLRPLVKMIESRLKLPRLTAVLLLFGGFALLVGGLFFLLAPPLITQLVDFIGYVPTLWDNVSNYTQAHYPDWIALAKRQLANPNVRKIADGLATESKSLFSHTIPSLQAAFGGLIDVFAFLTHVAIIPVYLFFFLLMRGAATNQLGRHLPFLSAGVRDDVVFLVSEFVSIIESFHIRPPPVNPVEINTVAGKLRALRMGAATVKLLV